MKATNLLKRKDEYRKVTLRSNYDKKKAVVRTRFDGSHHWLTRRSLRAAERRARLVSGDYFVLPEGMFVEQQ